jgi:hypothetical protein
MFDTTCYNYPVGIGGYKFYGITDIISPSCIIINNKRIILPYFTSLAQTAGIFIKYFSGGNEFKNMPLLVFNKSPSLPDYPDAINPSEVDTFQ